MNQFIIKRNQYKTKFAFKPHLNKTSLKYLIKLKSVNQTFGDEPEQRDFNSLFGLSFGFRTSIGFGFNLNGDYMYVYGYYKHKGKTESIYLTRCLIDNYYYLGFDVKHDSINFKVDTFQNYNKVDKSIPLHKEVCPFGLYTYTSLNKDFIKSYDLNLLMEEYK